MTTAHPHTAESAYLSTVVDALPHAVSAFRAMRGVDGEVVDFEWTYANAAAALVTGRLNAELIGHTLLELLPEHGPSGMFDVYRGVVETGDPHINPALWYEDTWGDGERQRRCFDIRATKVDDGFVVITREVTEQMLVQERLTNLDNAKNALIAAVAHDFRTPLTSVVGFSALLTHSWDSLPEEERRDMVSQIELSGEELERRIATVLDKIRLETGTMEIVSTRLSLGLEVREALERMPLVLAEHRVVIDIPPGTTVTADKVALARVVENLLVNAAKYSPRGSTITISAETQKCSVVTSVCDEGRGISDADAERVFDPFYRTADGKATAKGTGVGLSSVRQLLEMMSGRIWADRLDPSGTAFRFCLPRA